MLQTKNHVSLLNYDGFLGTHTAPDGQEIEIVNLVIQKVITWEVQKTMLILHVILVMKHALKSIDVKDSHIMIVKNAQKNIILINHHQILYNALNNVQ